MGSIDRMSDDIAYCTVGRPTDPGLFTSLTHIIIQLVTNDGYVVGE